MRLRLLPTEHARALTALTLSASLLGGCVIASSSSSYETGRQVTSGTIGKIRLGQTTEDWLVGALGEPTSRKIVQPGTPVEEPDADATQTGDEAVTVEEEDQPEGGMLAAEEAPSEENEGDGEGEAAAGGTADEEEESAEPAQKYIGRIEILRYDWSRREESGGAFLLIFSGSKTRTERSSAWFEVTDGVVTSYGVE